MSDLNEQSMADMAEQITKLLDAVGERIMMQPTEMIVPAATVQQVADERGITVEEAKEYLREAYRQRVWSTSTIEGDGLDLIGGNDGYTPDM